MKRIFHIAAGAMLSMGMLAAYTFAYDEPTEKMQPMSRFCRLNN